VEGPSLVEAANVSLYNSSLKTVYAKEQAIRGSGFTRSLGDVLGEEREFYASVAFINFISTVEKEGEGCVFCFAGYYS
jgi:hypothetical protein